jgi:hypothetical protein
MRRRKQDTAGPEGRTDRQNLENANYPCRGSDARKDAKARPPRLGIKEFQKRNSASRGHVSKHCTRTDRCVDAEGRLCLRLGRCAVMWIVGCVCKRGAGDLASDRGGCGLAPGCGVCPMRNPLCVVGVQLKYLLGESNAVVYLCRDFPKFPPVYRLSSDGRCELRSLGQSGRFPTGPSASGHLDPCQSEGKKNSATSATGVLSVDMDFGG